MAHPLQKRLLTLLAKQIRGKPSHAQIILAQIIYTLVVRPLQIAITTSENLSLILVLLNQRPNYLYFSIVSDLFLKPCIGMRSYNDQFPHNRLVLPPIGPKNCVRLKLDRVAT